MKNTAQILILIIILSLLFFCGEELDQLYLNQQPPGIHPIVFAPDLLDPARNLRDATFTLDGKTFYFTEILDSTFRIMFCSFQNGEWTMPSIAPFSGKHNDFEPVISRDGKSFYFGSMRPTKDKPNMTNDADIWMMRTAENGWSDPEILPQPITSSCMEYFPSVTTDGTLYFGRNDSAMTRGDVHFSRLIEGTYTKPEKLPEVVNLPASSFNAFIAPDERFLLFSTYLQDSSHWQSDLHIAFRSSDGIWSQPVNLGPDINSTGNDHAPWISHDGKYLFFSSSRLDESGKNEHHSIFWVSTKILEYNR